MKRTKVLGALFIASAVIFASCEKEVETSNLTLDKTQKATVRAYLYAELDNTLQGVEFAPNGTKVIVSIPNSSFNSSASGKWMDTVTVNNGMIEATVPTTNAGVTVTFTPAEFTADQVQPYGSVSNQILKLYKVTTSNTLSVYPNEIRTTEISYNSITAFQNNKETVTIKFAAKAILDETIGTEQNVPQGTIITLHNSGWSATATVGTEGKFEVAIPKGEIITARFEVVKTLATPPSKRYLYTLAISAYSSSTPVVQNLSFGGGSLNE